MEISVLEKNKLTSCGREGHRDFPVFTMEDFPKTTPLSQSFQPTPIFPVNVSTVNICKITYNICKLPLVGSPGDICNSCKILADPQYPPILLVAPKSSGSPNTWEKW